MPDFYHGNIPIIDTEQPNTNLSHPKDVMFGYRPRDYTKHPEAMFAPPSGMKLILPVDWDAYFDEQEKQQSSLEHIYLSGPNGTPAFKFLEQARSNYCWAYSTGNSMMIDMLKRGLKVPRLNPHAAASIIKRGANQGGWCGQSAEFGTAHGYAIEGKGQGQWPLHSHDLRFDTPALRAEMAKNKIDEQWTDLTRQIYDRNLTQNQVATSGFNNLPGPRDYNHWRHSVCGLRWVRVERGVWGQLILNSWLNWGRHGLGVLIGSKAICNGGLSIRSTTI